MNLDVRCFELFSSQMSNVIKYGYYSTNCNCCGRSNVRLTVIYKSNPLNDWFFKIAAIISVSIFPCSSRADERQPCSTTSSPINQETTTEKYPWHNNNVYPPNNRPHSQVPTSINLIDSNSTSPSANCSSKSIKI